MLPLLFLLILVIAQYAVWAHATHVAQTTAAHGLAAARVEDADAAAGRVEADRVLAQLGTGSLRQVNISVERGADRAQVHISGTANSVVPFLRLPVHAEAAGPVERFRPASREVANSEATTAEETRRGSTGTAP